MSQPDIRSSFRPATTDVNARADISFTVPPSMDRSIAGTEGEPPKKPNRLPALDFTKGVLVLIMVLYHWMNYFVIADGSVYKYLRFLTPSFIFITGFLISHVYLSRCKTGLRIPQRLLLRGFKLLGIVLGLNLALSMVHLTSATRLTVLSQGNLLSAYLTGTASVAFSVLVPIAYLLILSAGLVIVSAYFSYICHAVCAVSVACAVLCESTGINSGYLSIFSIGTIGLSIGGIPLARINRLMRHPLPIWLAYLMYLAAITFWDAIYLLQLVGVCLSLSVIYWFAYCVGREEEPSRIRKMMILLGQYSLYAYLGQIIILQVLHKSVRLLGDATFVSGAALLACSACTILSVEFIDRARTRLTLLNKLYAAVFS